MYLRTTSRRNKDGSVVRYLQLAHNTWDPQRKRSTTRILLNFGRADRVDRAALARLCDSIRRVALGETPGVPPGSGSWEILRSRPAGAVHAARALWEELGIAAIIGDLVPRRRNRAPHERALFAMVAHRLLDPGSKRACHLSFLRDGVYLPAADELHLEQLYRALDFLDEHAEVIERRVFESAAQTLGASVDLVFFDTTSTYFHTEEEDDLRRRGHSKDERPGNPQIVIAMAVTREGIPVRSWVLPGNTADVTVVKRIKQDLSEWKLGRVLLVGDGGMDSKDNRRALAKGLGHYILAVPSGRVAEAKEVLAHRGRFRRLDSGLGVKQVVIGKGERRRRYVVVHNPQEERRQQKHRAELLEQLAGELGSLDYDGDRHTRRVCGLLTSRRFGRFLSQDEDGVLDIDPKKVERAGRADGKTLLITNDDTIEPADVADAYRSLMIIESCFRRLKTTGLRIRPVYHWTEKRIEGHVKLCVLALLIQRTAEIRAGRSWAEIKNVLGRIFAVDCQVEGKLVVRTTKLSAEAVSLFDALGVKRPSPVLEVGPAPKPA